MKIRSEQKALAEERDWLNQTLKSERSCAS
jgi:hypothetical protein